MRIQHNISLPKRSMRRPTNSARTVPRRGSFGYLKQRRLHESRLARLTDARDCSALTSHCRRDSCSNRLRSASHRVIRKVGVAVSRRRLAMTEKRADHEEGLPGAGSNGRERMAEIVYADALEHGVLADPLPRLRQVDERAAGLSTADDPRPRISVELGKNPHRGGVEGHDLRARL